MKMTRTSGVGLDDIFGLHYMLDGRTPVRAKTVDDVRAVAAQSQTDAWRVGLDRVGQYEISTVFLGLDHQWQPDGPPLLFETMAFNSEGESVGMGRCTTFDEAEAKHKQVVEAVRDLVLQGRKLEDLRDE